MMLAKGVSIEDARDYCLMGCVEPQKSGKIISMDFYSIHSYGQYV